MLFPLLTNQSSGGVAAAIEVDEEKENCGRYGYCWPRDAVFITKAYDKLKMQKETEKFYKNFCKNTQNKNGMWEQRFYTDGRLAPCWGYQIDETASVIFGVYNHYKVFEDVKFLKDNLKMCEKALNFLQIPFFHHHKNVKVCIFLFLDLISQVLPFLYLHFPVLLCF